jgi:hypothetical protein
MHDSDEEAVALRPHPPELGRPAFVRHAAGGGGGMQQKGCFETCVWGGMEGTTAARGGGGEKVFVRR